MHTYVVGGKAGLDPTRLVFEAHKGKLVLRHFADATWWEWSRGSALVFGRWNGCIQFTLHGHPPFLLSSLPIFKRKSLIPADDKRSMIGSKLKTIFDRGYLVSGSVKSLIQFFDVPKADDIRLVYNGRSCG
jgi:hypothetical protein